MVVHWILTNFPPNTLPVFLPTFFILLVLNILVWRKLIRKSSK